MEGKSRKKVLAAILACVLCISVFAGCAAGTGTTEPAPDAGESASAPAETAAGENTPDAGNEPAEPAGELQRPEPISGTEVVNIADIAEYTKKEEGEPMTFALLLFSRGFEWMIGLQQEFEATCEQLGVTPIVLDAQGSDDTQLDQIQDMITQRVDAIILTPNSNDGLVAGVKMAQEAGIPLVTCESEVEGNIVPIHVGVDNYQMGQLAAEFIADKIGGKGKVLECRGALASLSSTARHDGFVETMANYPDIEVISKNTEWVSTEASSATQDVLTANPDLAAIYSHNDEMQTGIQSALREMGRLVPSGEDGHIVLVGIDGTPLGLERLREGIQDACVVQDPFDQGKYIANYAYDFLTGKDVPRKTLTQPYVVTQEYAALDVLWGNHEFEAVE
ncbi:sugar ABC transporter substrate-binding protein [Christensenella intestinihominis]|uniref:sugar ABC transporter substrate-binding protein n=1 Tax=Christensenella intestinihominis TaxID=1851429 RepID=UPI000837A2B5|nr:sugar ABC transporter substrate-binding protein [Christensenella intestinihominis]